MTNERRWSEVDFDFAKTLIGSDAALDEALAANSAAGLPSIDVSAPQGKLIHLLARMSGVRKALEIGTLGGYSTIWLARALARRRPAHHARSERQTCRGRAPKHRPRRAWRQGRDQNRRGARDAAQDRGRGARPVRLRVHRRRQDRTTRPISNGRCAFPGREPRSWSTMWCGRARSSTRRAADSDVVGVRRMFEIMAREPRLSATAIQTVGAKGWDGFALAI